MSLFSYFRSKTIKSLNVRIFENEVESTLENYTDYHLTEIKLAIEEILNKRKGYFWFEVNIYEQCGFFRKRKLLIQVEFMRENHNSISGKKRISIPNDFLDSYTNKKIPIQPKKILVKAWPEELSIEIF